MPSTHPKPASDDDESSENASTNLHPVDAPDDTPAPTQHASQHNNDTTEDEQQDRQVDDLVAGVQALHVAPPTKDAHPQLLRIARLIQDGKCKKIVCMCGAGISVSAGIPDFRTPGMR